MKTINYAEYERSYAYALKPKLRALYGYTFLSSKPAAYIKKVVLNTLKDSNVAVTDKEQQFITDILQMDNSEAIYWRVRNAVRAAEKFFIQIDDSGKPIAFN